MAKDGSTKRSLIMDLDSRGALIKRENQIYVPYRKKGVTYLRPYEPGENLAGVSVSPEDTPELGGQIAINKDKPEDKWYISKEYFETNYEPA